MKAPSRTVTAALVPLILILVTAAWAQDTIIDPATLQINTGNGFLWNGELNKVTGTTVSVNQNQGGKNSTLVNPVLILLGMAGNNNTPPTLITSTTNGSYTVLSNSGLLTSGTVWGVNFSSQTSTNPISVLSSSSGSSSAYDVTGLQNTGAFGQIWTNWSGAYTSLIGNSPANNQFQIFAYAVYLNPNITGNNNTLGSIFQVQFSSLASGSYIIAFGCQGVSDTTASCPGSSTNPYTTPFTQTGFVENPPGPQTPPVPEPASMVLFGSGLVAAAGMIRRRLHR